MYPTDRKYSREHEWALLESASRALVGITEFAQGELGDVVYVDLPQVGSRVTQFGKVGEIESVKAVSDLYSPVGGVVAEANAVLVERPELVNDDPYGAGWLIKVDLADPSELDNLLTAEEYQSLVG